LIAWLKKLAEDVETVLRWLEGQAEPALPTPQDPSHDASDGTSSGTTQDHQRQRLHAFGVHANALVILRGNPERGGLLQVNTRSVNLSPTEWPFALLLAEAMQQYRVFPSPQRGLGFVTKEVLAARAQELTSHIRTTFRPTPEVVRVYIARIRDKLKKHGIDSCLIETQRRLGWRLSTLPEHIVIVRENA
jgi:hypothetical protein